MKVRVKNGGKKIEAYPTPFTNEALRDPKTVWTCYENQEETYLGEDIVPEDWSREETATLQTETLKKQSEMFTMLPTILGTLSKPVEIPEMSEEEKKEKIRLHFIDSIANAIFTREDLLNVPVSSLEKYIDGIFGVANIMTQKYFEEY